MAAGRRITVNDLFDRTLPDILRKIFVTMMPYKDFHACIQVCSTWRRKLLQLVQSQSNLKRKFSVDRWVYTWMWRQVKLHTDETAQWDTETLRSYMLHCLDFATITPQGHYVCVYCRVYDPKIVCSDRHGKVLFCHKLPGSNFITAASKSHVLMSYNHDLKTLVFNLQTFELVELRPAMFLSVVSNQDKIYCVRTLVDDGNGTQVKIKKLVCTPRVALKEFRCLKLEKSSRKIVNHKILTALSGHSSDFVVLSLKGGLHLFDLNGDKLKWHVDLGWLPGCVDILITSSNVVLAFFRSSQENQDTAISLYVVDSSSGNLVDHTSVQVKDVDYIDVIELLGSHSTNDVAVVASHLQKGGQVRSPKLYVYNSQLKTMEHIDLSRFQVQPWLLHCQLVEGRLLFLSLFCVTKQKLELFVTDLKDLNTIRSLYVSPELNFSAKFKTCCFYSQALRYKQFFNVFNLTHETMSRYCILFMFKVFQVQVSRLPEWELQLVNDDDSKRIRLDSDEEHPLYDFVSII